MYSWLHSITIMSASFTLLFSKATYSSPKSSGLCTNNDAIFFIFHQYISTHPSAIYIGIFTDYTHINSVTQTHVYAFILLQSFFSHAMFKSNTYTQHNVHRMDTIIETNFTPDPSINCKLSITTC